MTGDLSEGVEDVVDFQHAVIAALGKTNSIDEMGNPETDTATDTSIDPDNGSEGNPQEDIAQDTSSDPAHGSEDQVDKDLD